jgi:hypothetical protein
MINRVEIFKRANKKLELLINGLPCKDDFTSENWDATTESELNIFLASTEGQERLTGYFQDKLDQEIYYDSTDADTTGNFDGTNFIGVRFVDQS